MTSLVRFPPLTDVVPFSAISGNAERRTDAPFCPWFERERTTVAVSPPVVTLNDWVKEGLWRLIIRGAVELDAPSGPRGVVFVRPVILNESMDSDR